MGVGGEGIRFMSTILCNPSVEGPTRTLALKNLIDRDRQINRERAKERER